MNDNFTNLLKTRGLAESTIYGLFRIIQDEVFNQFNWKTRIITRELPFPEIYEILSYDTDYMSLNPNGISPVYSNIQRIKLEPRYYGFAIYGERITLKMAYSGLMDTLYIDPRIFIEDMIFRYKSQEKAIQFPVCPRCGSKDFKQYGIGLPKFLQVKQAVTCKRCGHTAHSKEFK